MSENKTINAWRSVVQSKSHQQLSELLANDVVFHSPILHTPQEGKQMTMFYLTAAMAVLFEGEFKYRREIVNDSNAVLEFETEIDGITVNGVDLLTYNEAGKITDFKVMVRPLKAVHLVKEKMFAELERLSALNAK